MSRGQVILLIIIAVLLAVLVVLLTLLYGPVAGAGAVGGAGAGASAAMLEAQNRRRRETETRADVARVRRQGEVAAQKPPTDDEIAALEAHLEWLEGEDPL